MTKEILENFNIKNFLIFALSICLSFFGGALFVKPADKGFQTGIHTAVKNIIKPDLKNIEESIKLNTEFRINEYIRIINLNVKSILLKPDSVEKYNVLLSISYLKKIPKERKDESLKANIAVIIKWNLENP